MDGSFFIQVLSGHFFSIVDSFHAVLALSCGLVKQRLRLLSIIEKKTRQLSKKLRLGLESISYC